MFRKGEYIVISPRGEMDLKTINDREHMKEIIGCEIFDSTLFMIAGLITRIYCDDEGMNKDKKGSLLYFWDDKKLISLPGTIVITNDESDNEIMPFDPERNCRISDELGIVETSSGDKMFMRKQDFQKLQQLTRNNQGSNTEETE
jgi:hypothetical protein